MQKHKVNTVSFCIPTYNAGKVLEPCLNSIRSQKYDQSKIEIIIIDAGSTDNTLNIAHQFNALIFSNPLKTGEAGKSIGISKAKGEYIALIDSDNILPHRLWLRSMIRPLINGSKIVGSEPKYFTYRPKAGFIERYSSLLGANDPYAFFCGLYDRYSYLTKRWTNLPLNIKVKNKYSQILIKPGQSIPTIGANGTIFRSRFLKKYHQGSYYFDIDIINRALTQLSKPIYFSKTNQSIIHTYCENSIAKFYIKQTRRVNDYLFYLPLRSFDWKKANSISMYIFPLYSISLIFPLYHSIKGYLSKPDLAWFFHPIACLITSFVYIKGYLFRHPTDRSTWHQ